VQLLSASELDRRADAILPEVLAGLTVAQPGPAS